MANVIEVRGVKIGEGVPKIIVPIVGVTKDEMMEAMVIGSFMAMTRSQSYAFRVLQDLYKE